MGADIDTEDMFVEARVVALQNIRTELAKTYNGRKYGINTERLNRFMSQYEFLKQIPLVFFQSKDIPLIKVRALFQSKGLMPEIGDLIEENLKTTDDYNGIINPVLRIAFIKLPDKLSGDSDFMDFISVFEEAIAIHETAHGISSKLCNRLSKIWKEGFANIFAEKYLVENLSITHLKRIAKYFNISDSEMTIGDIVDRETGAPAYDLLITTRKSSIRDIDLEYRLAPSYAYRLAVIIRGLISIRNGFLQELLDVQIGNLSLQDFKNIVNNLFPSGFNPNEIVPDFGKDLYTYLTRTGSGEEDIDYNIDNKIRLIKALYQFYQEHGLLKTENQ